MPSPPEYRNSKLEKQIADNTNQAELNLSRSSLTAQDMEIVAYYAIRQSKVIEFTEIHLLSYIVSLRVFSKILNQQSS